MMNKENENPVFVSHKIKIILKINKINNQNKEAKSLFDNVRIFNKKVKVHFKYLGEIENFNLK